MAERNSHLMAKRNSQLMAEYEFMRMKKLSNLTNFGRTDLRISLSGAKFDEEIQADFDVHSAVGPPKPHQIDKKLTFRSKISPIFFFHKFSASKNRKLQIFRNARCRSFAPIEAKFEG